MEAHQGSPVPGILQARTLEWVAISFSNAWKWKVKVKSLSRVQLLMTPWTAAHQAPPSMEFSRQEYWSGLPLPSPLEEGSTCQKKKKNLFATREHELLTHFNLFWELHIGQKVESSRWLTIMAEGDSGVSTWRVHEDATVSVWARATERF